MAPKVCLVVFLLFFSRAESASLIERSYEYVMNVGKNLAPSLMSILDCFGEEQVWSCAREKAGKILNTWEEENNKQRQLWQEAADAEAASSGRSLEEMPSKVGKEVEDSLTSLTELVQHGIARALNRQEKKKHDSGGIDSITISTGGGDKMKKKKKKPAKLQLVHPVMMVGKQDKGPKVQSWVIGHEPSKDEVNGSAKEFSSSISRESRGLLGDFWELGEKALDAAAEHALESDNSENGLQDRSSIEEQRGKKKKKKKAILKLLILGAVLKAKIGTLLAILSFKLQVKFFIIALIGLGINLARFWIELKKQHQQPQKRSLSGSLDFLKTSPRYIKEVVYYEHAQHQHHYEHEDEPGPGWGPWSRSIVPTEDTDVEVDLDIQNNPYRAQNPQAFSRPLLSRV